MVSKIENIQLDEIIESLQDAVWSVAWPTFDLLYVSPAVSAIYGFSVEEFYADPTLWVTRIHPDDAEKTEALFQQIIELIYLENERRIIHKDGSVRWINDRARVIFDGNGEAQRIDGIVRDITAYKETELALKERIRSEQLVATISRSLLQASSDTMQETIVDVLRSIGDMARADRAYSIVFEQDSLCIVQGQEWCSEGIPYHVDGVIGYDMAGFPWYAEKLRQREPVHIPSVQHMPPDAAILQQVLLGESVKSLLTMPMVMEDKLIGFVGIDSLKQHQTWSQVTVTLLQVASDLLVYAMAHRKTETRLQQLNDQLQKALEAKDQFLANMSHELRTPLHALLLKTEMLQAGLYGSLTEKQAKSMEIIFDSGQHLLDLINDVLDLAKIGAGKIDLVREPVLVESLCQTSLKFVKQLAFDKEIEVSLNVDRGVRYVMGDERRLKQILVNLLSNAVNYTPRGGEVSLAVYGLVEQQQIHFVVQDSGIGIAKPNHARVFEPFVQLESRGNEQVGGTGLGLSLVKRMTTLHGGEVLLDSELGKGSRFTVVLPWKPDELVGEGMSKAVDDKGVGLFPAGADNHPLILIAEDNQVVVESLLDFFEHQQYRTIVARHGLDVLSILQNVTPDVILMDIQMPFMNGLDTIKRLRSDENFADVPIIALTAYAMSSDRERCMEAGANAFLSKPLNLQELSRSIAQMLKGSA